MATTVIIITAMDHIAMAMSHRILISAVGAVVAIGLGFVSLISLAAAVIALPAGNTVALLRQGEPVRDERIEQAAEASFRAGRIFERGRYYSDAILAASRLSGGARERVFGNMPLDKLVDEALVAGPASAQNWARRSSLQLAAGHYREAEGSLEASILFGRFVPGLTVPRLRILVDLMKRAPDAKLEAFFADQVSLAAKTEPMKLAELADGGAAEGMTQRVLFSDFESYNHYLTALARVRADRRRVEHDRTP
jgi:hypothetical protein